MQTYNVSEICPVTESLEAYMSECLNDPSVQRQHLAGAGAIHILEKKLQGFYNKKFAVVFSNATSALQTLALALELNNAEVLTSPINWGGSIAPFLLHGNKLRFVAYDPLTLNLCAGDLFAARSTRTKAVLSVDYNGVPADSKTIREFCEQHDLIYISDSAQSFGAFRDGYPAGFFADVIVLSFSPSKSLFAGEGGAILTDDDNIYQKVLWFSQHPSRQKSVLGLSNYNEYAPINGRMNPLASVLLSLTFNVAISKLVRYQQTCFELIQKLAAERLITAPYYLDRPEASTYFRISLELTPSASNEKVNLFLKQLDLPFVATESTVRLIPFDPSFVKQFNGRFSCSKSLRCLRRKNPTIRRIALHNSDGSSLKGKDN